MINWVMYGLTAVVGALVVWWLWSAHVAGVELQGEISRLGDEIILIQESHQEEIEAMRQAFEKELKPYTVEINNLKAANHYALAAAKDDYKRQREEEMATYWEDRKRSQDYLEERHRAELMAMRECIKAMKYPTLYTKSEIQWCENEMN